MILDLDLNNPAHLKEVRQWVEKNADRFPLVGFDIVSELLAHAEQVADLKKKVAMELGFLLAKHVDKLDVEPAELLGLTPAQWKRHNSDIRAAAARAGIEMR